MRSAFLSNGIGNFSLNGMSNLTNIAIPFDKRILLNVTKAHIDDVVGSEQWRPTYVISNLHQYKRKTCKQSWTSGQMTAARSTIKYGKITCIKFKEVFGILRSTLEIRVKSMNKVAVGVNKMMGG